MAHNDIHIEVDRDNGTVKAEREVHQDFYSFTFTPDDGGESLEFGPGVQIQMVPLPIVGEDEPGRVKG